MADQEAMIPEDMQELHRRLEEWRATHRPRSPLPDELWSMAVGLAQRHNIHRVARTFGLDYGALKRRMPGSTPEPVATFVELIAPSFGQHCRMQPGGGLSQWRAEVAHSDEGRAASRIGGRDPRHHRLIYAADHTANAHPGRRRAGGFQERD